MAMMLAEFCGSTPGAGATPTGTWGTSTFWSTNSAGTNATTAYVDGSSVIFSAGADAVNAYTVTVNGTQSIAGLTVEEGTPTITNGTLNLTLAETPFNLTGNATVTAIIAGSGFGLTKSGAGTLILTNALNTFNGGLKIVEGTLSVSNVNNVNGNGPLGPGSSAITLGSSGKTGTLLVTAPTSIASTKLFTLADGGIGEINCTLSTYALTLSANKFTSAIDGGGGLTKSGPGTLVLYQASNTFAGQVVVNGGTLRLTSNGGTSAAATLANAGTASALGTGNSNSIIRLGGTAAGTLACILNAAASTDRQIQIGSGATSTFAGAINNDATAGGGLTFTAPNFNVPDSAATVARGLALGGTGSYINEVTGIIADNSAIGGVVSITKNTAGSTWKLSGANTYSGRTTLVAGTLIVSNLNSVTKPTPAASSSLGKPSSASNGTIPMGVTTNPGKLIYVGANDETTDRIIALAGTTGGALLDQSGFGKLKFTSAFTAPTNGAKTLTLQGSTTGSGEIAGAIVDSGSGATTLIKLGSGTWVLSGVNTYSGATTISEGKLVGVTGGSASSSTATLTGATATFGVLIADNTKQWTFANLTTASAPVLDFYFANALAPSTTSAPLIITGAAAFTSQPTVTVEGANLAVGTYPLMTWGSTSGTVPTAVTLPVGVEGYLSVVGSTLKLTITASTRQPLKWGIADGTWNINASSSWMDNSSNPVTYLETPSSDAVQFEDTASGAAPITVTLDTAVSPASVTVNNPTKDYTISGAGQISGGTSLTKSGAGNLTLDTANTYTGGTTINGGTVKLGATGALAGNISVLSAGKLDVSSVPSGFILAYGQMLSGGGTVTGRVTVATGATLRPGLGGTDTSSTLSFNNSLSLAGTTLLTINRTNTPNANKLAFGGALTNGGTLTVSNVGDALQANDTFTLFNGATPPAGVFSATNLPSISTNLVWSFSNGILRVATKVNQTPTNIVAVVGGGFLNLSWPADQIGWELQGQTNALGLSTNWTPVPGSTTTNQVSLPIDPANPPVFFRLHYQP